MKNSTVILIVVVVLLLVGGGVGFYFWKKKKIEETDKKDKKGNNNNNNNNGGGGSKSDASTLALQKELNKILPSLNPPVMFNGTALTHLVEDGIFGPRTSAASKHVTALQQKGALPKTITNTDSNGTSTTTEVKTIVDKAIDIAKEDLSSLWNTTKNIFPWRLFHYEGTPNL